MIKHLLLVGIFLFTFTSPFFAQQMPSLGIVADLEKDSLAYASGFRLMGVTVGSTISPSLREAQFVANLQKINKMRCQLYLCNVLFPSTLKIAGPEVNEKEVMDYFQALLARAKAVGVKHLVLGSGGARRLPDGYEAEKAKADFVTLGRKMANAARSYDVVILLESLNSTETNFLNKLSEAADVVRRVNHPNLRLNADIYHMLKEGESPEAIRNAADVIVYAEIAEKDGRSFPGKKGEDFRPYLQALKDIEFKGPLFIEGRSDDWPVDLPKALSFLTKQLGEVYHQP